MSNFQAVILAAGIGYRLLPYTKNRPKAMIDINGKPILSYILDSLVQNNIQDVIIVVGYKKNNIISFVEKYYFNKFKNITFVENKKYNKTNNIYSLWLARNEIYKDFILIESDLIFEPQLINKILTCRDKNLVVVDKKEKWMDGTVVKIDTNRKVIDFILNDFKDNNEYAELYKTVNVYKFSIDFWRKKFLPMLDLYIKTQPLSKYYEVILKILSQMDYSKLKAYIIKDIKWFEIDTIADIYKAEVLFSSPREKYKKLSEMFGGLWDFDILDFNFVTNPYFPPIKLRNKLEEYSPNLIQGYSSTQNIVDAKMSSVLNVEQDYLLTTNGSSQIIKILSFLLNKEKVGILYPNFDEYLIFNNKELIYTFPEDNFTIDINDLKRAIKDKGIDVLILSNPNNPTGQIIHPEYIEELLSMNYLKFVIVDESFIDFAPQEYSMIKRFKNFNNLIILKSLGKSLGIPGLRLGVIITKNKKILEEIRNHLPIWNINSFAEKFLEEFPKYKKLYVYSLRKIQNEREKFIENLKNLKNIKIFPSFANFFLLKIEHPNLNATDIAIKMLEKNIFIKDVTSKIKSKNKKENSSYFRVAVRKKEENYYFYEELRRILHI